MTEPRGERLWNWSLFNSYYM